MKDPTQKPLKRQEYDFWNEQRCDPQAAKAAKFTREYFEEIESFPYFDQPFIHSFAPFPATTGSGCWKWSSVPAPILSNGLRAGARVSGIDLTPEALENVRHRVQTNDLPARGTADTPIIAAPNCTHVMTLEIAN